MKNLLTTLVLMLALSLSHANDFIDEITQVVGSGPSVNINLSNGLMKTLLAFADDEDADEVAKILSDLNKLRVSVYSLENTQDSQTLNTLIADKIEALTSQGYEQIVTVKEQEESVHVLAKIQNQYLKDVLIVVLEEKEELVVISMDGQVDLKQLAQLSDHFDVDLESILTDI